MTGAQYKLDVELKKAPQISPSWVSYGLFIVSILETIDGVVTSLYCLW